MKEFFTTFAKGVVVGLGGVAPGLSGSVLLVIFGLYQKVIGAISTLFKNFKENMKLLIPVGSGMVIGVLLFSKLVEYILINFPMQTRFGFLGLIVGTLPLFFREVKKEGFHPKYYAAMAAGLAVGAFLFYANPNLFPEITDPNFVQAMVIGLVVAAAYIIPGVDSAAILMALGMYKLWTASLANLNFAVLLPAAIGLGVGVLVISFGVNKLLRHAYTATFSFLFGLFISIIPKVLEKDPTAVPPETWVFGNNVDTYISIGLLVICTVASLLFSNLERLKDRKKETA